MEYIGAIVLLLGVWLFSAWQWRRAIREVNRLNKEDKKNNTIRFG